jgi:hypothetical protein
LLVQFYEKWLLAYSIKSTMSQILDSAKPVFISSTGSMFAATPITSIKHKYEWLDENRVDK